MIGNDDFATVQVEQNHLALIGQRRQAVKRALIGRLGICSSRCSSGEPRKLRLANERALQGRQFEFFLECDFGQGVNFDLFLSGNHQLMMTVRLWLVLTRNGPIFNVNNVNAQYWCAVLHLEGLGRDRRHFGLLTSIIIGHL